MAEILLLSRERGTSDILRNLLGAEGFNVVCERDVANAGKLVESHAPALIIADAGATSPFRDEVLDFVRRAQSKVSVVLIAEPVSGQAADPGDLKVFARFGKPFKVDQLLAAVQKAVDYGGKLKAAALDLDLQLETRYLYESIVAESAAMRSVCDMVSRVASTDVAVLITGEAGTGKTLVSRTIHAHSRRKDRPFVSFVCSGQLESALENRLVGQGDRKGALEEANGGTIFLQDVGALPPAIQKKFAGCVRDRKLVKAGKSEGIPIDVRVIAAADRSLKQLIKDGALGGDLYKLLSSICVHIPPLRERREDILPIVRLALRKRHAHGSPMPKVSQEIGGILEQYSWPGNVRELENALEQALKASGGAELTKEGLITAGVRDATAGASN